MGISCEIAHKWMQQNTFDDVNIGSGNGLMPSGNKKLLAAWQHQAITWGNVDPDLNHHFASVGHNCIINLYTIDYST